MLPGNRTKGKADTYARSQFIERSGSGELILVIFLACLQLACYMSNQYTQIEILQNARMAQIVLLLYRRLTKCPLNLHAFSYKTRFWVDESSWVIPLLKCERFYKVQVPGICGPKSAIHISTILGSYNRLRSLTLSGTRIMSQVLKEICQSNLQERSMK